MRIEGRDQTGLIEINRRDEGGFAILAVEAAISGFMARDQSVIIDNTAEFLHALDAFERTRHGQALLRGTEDGFELRLSALDRAGHFWVGIRITRAPLSNDHPEPLIFTGGFPFDADYATGLFAGLRELMTPATAVR